MKSILIIGLGRFGRHMAAKFIEEGNSVLAIEKNAERADNAINIIDNIQIGDATNEIFMQSLGIKNFDICVVAIGDNFQNALEITVLLKDNGAKFILARACKPRRTQKAAAAQRRRQRRLCGTRNGGTARHQIRRKKHFRLC